MSHPELPWDKSEIIWNPNVTINDILAHPEIEWHRVAICYKKNITLDFMINYLGVNKIVWNILPESSDNFK